MLPFATWLLSQPPFSLLSPAWVHKATRSFCKHGHFTLKHSGGGSHPGMPPTKLKLHRRYVTVNSDQNHEVQWSLNYFFLDISFIFHNLCLICLLVKWEITHSYLICATGFQNSTWGSQKHLEPVCYGKTCGINLDNIADSSKIYNKFQYSWEMLVLSLEYLLVMR